MEYKITSVSLWRKRFITAAILCLPFIYFIAVDLFGTNVPYASVVKPYGAPLSFILATVAIVYLGSSFFHSAIYGLRRHVFNADSLIFIGTIVAYAYSWTSYIVYIIDQKSFLLDYSFVSPHLYFETVVFLFFFVTLGKFIEARAISSNYTTVRKLIHLRPRTACLINSGNKTNVPLTRVRANDRVLVMPNEVIPVDGVIVHGLTDVDESMITGESALVAKKIGDTVIGGTVNGVSQIEIIVTSNDKSSTLSRIIHIMQNARSLRCTANSITDKISTVLVIFSLSFAFITFMVWFYILGAPLSAALIAFISVLMVACPCAFGLAAPAALSAGINFAAKLKILVKNASVLQMLAKADTIIFDKTGTLTTGEPTVTQIIAVSCEKLKALCIAASLEQQNNTVIAKAIVAHAEANGLQLKKTTHYALLSRRGISARINNVTYYIGNTEFTKKYSKHRLPDNTKLHNIGKHVQYLFTKNELLASFIISDQPKSSSKAAIEALNALGVDTYLLSGDNAATSRSIAHRVGIKNIMANITPEGKVEAILKLQQAGHRVVMVGDGTNDAPAIASADVGISMSNGTDVAISAGDIVLSSNDLMNICHAISIARVTRVKVMQNIFFATFFNLLAMPIATGAFAAHGVALHTETASLLMVLSTLAVVINSSTIRTIKPGKSDVITILAPLALFTLMSAIYLILLFY